MDMTPGAVMSGGRRIISILFCDVRGSTATAGQLDPEEWAEIMNGAFERIMQPVYRYEGTVVRLLGDAMLAFFGAPIAREDDPQRAVLAGLEIQEAIRAYAAGVQQEWGVSFSVRCGINTGLVVVGAFGGSQHAEYTAMGDAVNLAARMEQTAAPGTVQISEATYRLVAPLFEVDDLGRIEVKGKEEPQRAYRVLRRRAEPGSLRGIPGVEPPMVGRGMEFGTLVSAIERLQRGGGGIIFIEGDAGLGKSRLIRELEKYTTGIYPQTRWFQTGSFSYERAQPYGQVQRLLRDVCEIVADDAPNVQREKIASTLAIMTLPDAEQTRQALEAILGVEDESQASSRLEGEAFKGRLYVTMTAFWQELASMFPIVVAFDDVQWADAASVELMEHVLSDIGEPPVLVLYAMRPSEQSPGWTLLRLAERQFADHLRLITLQPLSPNDSEQLINSLLPEGKAAEGLREQILERAAGNPLFVEEVVRVLRDGATAQTDGGRPPVAGGDDSLEIPDNLQTLLTARVDHLPPEVRETLLLASVLGPAVNFRVLARISDHDLDRLTDHVHELERMGLVKETARTPDLVYSFVHGLLQETAYRMILRRQRRQYHLRVGETLEDLYKDGLEENAVVLAQHFDRAADLVARQPLLRPCRRRRFSSLFAERGYCPLQPRPRAGATATTGPHHRGVQEAVSPQGARPGVGYAVGGGVGNLRRPRRVGEDAKGSRCGAGGDGGAAALVRCANPAGQPETGAGTGRDGPAARA